MLTTFRKPTPVIRRRAERLIERYSLPISGENARMQINGKLSPADLLALSEFSEVEYSQSILNNGTSAIIRGTRNSVDILSGRKVKCPWVKPAGQFKEKKMKEKTKYSEKKFFLVFPIRNMQLNMHL